MMYMIYKAKRQFQMLSGAKVNWVNEDDEHKTALHQSVLGVGLT